MPFDKDFDAWNKKKKEINSFVDDVIFNEGEVWWCSVGVNIDAEIDDKNDWFERPVLIIKRINQKTAWVIPLSTTKKENIYVYPLTTLVSCVSISQLRIVSQKRLLRKVIRISEEEFAQIIIRIKYILTYK